MKFAVIEKPTKPEDCVFSIRNCEYGWICRNSRQRCNVNECTYFAEIPKPKFEIPCAGCQEFDCDGCDFNEYLLLREKSK